MRKFNSYILLPALAFFISFSVYVYTLYPSIAAGDNTEMVASALVLGIPHHSSYPVNTITGFLFSLLPIGGDVVWRVNLHAAFFQAATVVLFYFLVVSLFSISRKPLTKDRIGSYLCAFSGSLFLAFSLIFWEYALKFEVFPLNNFYVVLLLLLSVKVFRSSQEQRKRLLLYFIAFVFGLALTHHQTSVLIIPALLVMLSKEIRSLLQVFFQTIRAFFLGEKKIEQRGSYRQLVFLSICFFLGAGTFLSLLWLSSMNPPLNWGEPKNLSDALAAFLRRDAGSIRPFVGFTETTKHTPAEQSVFYIKSLVTDFSFLGVALAVVGMQYVWRVSRRIFLFTILGFSISGVVFLAYANFPLAGSFAEATVRRFHMLPNIFFAIFISFGLRFLYQFLDGIGSLAKTSKETAYGIVLGKSLLVLSFLFLFFVQFQKANNKNNTLTIDYTTQVYKDTPKNALIMLSGDVPLMTGHYFKYVIEKNKDNRIIFSPGQFHLSWHIPQLKKRYPHLVIPFQRPGKLYTTATQVVEANFERQPIYVAPDLVEKDPELDQKFALYPRHGLFLVKKKGEALNLEKLREENDALWKKLNPKLMHEIMKKTPSFEETIVFYYQRHFFNTGFVYEDVKLYDDAIREYERALEIEPKFKEALSSLARVYGTKLEKPDFAKAQKYLDRYLGSLKDTEIENAKSAIGMKEELRQREIQYLVDEEKKIATQSANVASGSAEASRSAVTN